MHSGKNKQLFYTVLLDKDLKSLFNQISYFLLKGAITPNGCTTEITGQIM